MHTFEDVSPLSPSRASCRKLPSPSPSQSPSKLLLACEICHAAYGAGDRLHVVLRIGRQPVFWAPSIFDHHHPPFLWQDKVCQRIICGLHESSAMLLVALETGFTSSCPQDANPCFGAHGQSHFHFSGGGNRAPKKWGGRGGCGKRAQLTGPLIVHYELRKTEGWSHCAIHRGPAGPQGRCAGAPGQLCRRQSSAEQWSHCVIHRGLAGPQGRCTGAPGQQRQQSA